MGLEIILDRMDVFLVIGIIVVIQVIKILLEKYRKKDKCIPTWVWKVSVIVAGVVAGVISTLIKGKGAVDIPWMKVIFIYAAGSTIVYQTGKPIYTRILKYIFPDYKPVGAKKDDDKG